MGKQAHAEIDRMDRPALARYVRKTAEHYDNLAIHADGPVPSTWELMDEQALANFFRAAYRLAGGEADG